MDYKLRQLERLKHEEHDAWIYGMARAGKIGPTNLAVLGMLGHQPAINIMGGSQRPSLKHNYWFKNRWFLESKLCAEGFIPSYYGTNYLPNMHRLWFHAKITGWMLEVLANLSSPHRSEQEVWLTNLENRQQFLGTILKEI